MAKLGAGSSDQAFGRGVITTGTALAYAFSPAAFSSAGEVGRGAGSRNTD